MKIRVLIEGLLLLVIGLICFVEGVRLVNNIDRNAVKDVLGPGYYILSISILLIIIAIVYILMNRKLLSESVALQRESAKQASNKIVIRVTLVFLAYILLIYIIGYFFATLIFFFLEFRLTGVKSLKTNVAVSAIVSIVFYIVFIQYCNLVFPHGVFAEFNP